MTKKKRSCFSGKPNKKNTVPSAAKSKKIISDENNLNCSFSLDNCKSFSRDQTSPEISVPSPDAASLPKPSLCHLQNKKIQSNKITSYVCEPNFNIQNKKISSSAINYITNINTLPLVPHAIVQNSDNKTLDKKHKRKPNKTTSDTKNYKVTDYFPIRRSNRKPVYTLLQEKQKILEEIIVSGIEDGFEIKEFPGKGRGIVTTKFFKRGEFVLEYSGELISIEEAKMREQLYSAKESTGCYMYYFKHKDKQYCVDATADSGKLGRLVNHSKKGNLKTSTFCSNNSPDNPHLILVASRDIEVGEELLYDYGDRSKVSLEFYPWLAL